MSIERRIIIGLITSTEFTQQIRPAWDSQLLESKMARRLAHWCLEYFDKYNRAPGKDIEGIYFQKLEAGLPKDIAEEIEEDILPSLSDEFTEEKFNLNYLLDQTRTYFKQKHLLRHTERIQNTLEDGELSEVERIIEAEKLAIEYSPPPSEFEQSLDLSNAASLKRIEKAFTQSTQPVVRYPGALGEFWNHQLVRGGFVALLGRDKRGKSFWLLDMAIRGARQGTPVAFFQAGDMTEDQQLKRICVYVAQRSNLEKYSGEVWYPVRDCLRNQLDTCDFDERVCDFGVFEDLGEKELKKSLTITMLKQAYADYPDYTPCRMCGRVCRGGSPWIGKVDTGRPLSVREAEKGISNFFIKNSRRFKLSTHANSTLTLREMDALLDLWEREDGFIPGMIAVDYADLLVPESNSDYRHQIDYIWKGLRRISQERHALMVTVTHTDTAGYSQDLLNLGNFSEDRRKNAHVTAIYGLNQDSKDREKDLGLMRINEIVVREGDSSSNNVVTTLQCLNRGRPFISSFW